MQPHARQEHAPGGPRGVTGRDGRLPRSRNNSVRQESNRGVEPEVKANLAPVAGGARKVVTLQLPGGAKVVRVSGGKMRDSRATHK